MIEATFRVKATGETGRIIGGALCPCHDVRLAFDYVDMGLYSVDEDIYRLDEIERVQDD